MVRRYLRLKKLLPILLGAGLVLPYVTNASFGGKPIGLSPVLVAHRGLGPGYDRQGLSNDTCTVMLCYKRLL